MYALRDHFLDLCRNYLAQVISAFLDLPKMKKKRRKKNYYHKEIMILFLSKVFNQNLSKYITFQELSDNITKNPDIYMNTFSFSQN